VRDIVFYSGKFSALKQLAETQKLLGNNEVVLCSNFSAKGLQELKSELNKENFAVKFFSCYLLLNSSSKELNKFKYKTDFIAVLGGSIALNNFAVSNKKIDFLLRPCLQGRFSFDTALIKKAKDNKTEIVVPFSQFLHSSQADRISLTKNYSFLLKIAKKFKLHLRIASFAQTLNELRSVNDLEEFKKFLEKKFERVSQ
jgi:RNase P/RNase MRP subunit p30